jgi:hypothetical protein
MDNDTNKYLKNIRPMLEAKAELDRIDSLFGPDTKAYMGATSELERFENRMRKDHLTAVNSLFQLDAHHPTHRQLDAFTGSLCVIEAQERIARERALGAAAVLRPGVIPMITETAKEYASYHSIAEQVAKEELHRRLFPRVSDLIAKDTLFANGIADDVQTYIARLNEQTIESAHGYLNPTAIDIAKLISPSIDDYITRHHDTYAAAFGGIAASQAVMQAVERMHHPWMRVTEPEHSIKAMLDLTAIGAALQQPLNTSLNDLLREEFGKWQGITRYPAEVATDSQARQRFYLEHGFNTDLLELPEGALDNALRATGIAYVEEGNDESTIIVVQAQDADLAANMELYQEFFKLENNLRRFIDSHLSVQHGSDWILHVVLVETVAKWKKDKKDAEKRSGRDLPLLYYVNFSDLERIILANLDKVFEPFFCHLDEDVGIILRRLRWIRNDIAHNRPVTAMDQTIAWPHIRQLNACLEYH